MDQLKKYFGGPPTPSPSACMEAAAVPSSWEPQR